MLYRDPPTAQNAVISIADGVEAGSIRLPRHKKRKSHKSVDENRDPQATRGVAISIADGVEADSIRLPHNAKKKNRAKSAVLLFCLSTIKKIFSGFCDRI